MKTRFNKTEQVFVGRVVRSLRLAQLRARNNLEVQFNPFLVQENLVNIGSQLDELELLLNLTMREPS